MECSEAEHIIEPEVPQEGPQDGPLWNPALHTTGARRSVPTGVSDISLAQRGPPHPKSVLGRRDAGPHLLEVLDEAGGDDFFNTFPTSSSSTMGKGPLCCWPIRVKTRMGPPQAAKDPVLPQLRELPGAKTSLEQFPNSLAEVRE
ncbi:hypothetical protein ACJJTC_013974 [Scirpophaga incertulas]